ncbi:hypothetical protein TELCIR_01563 [Teladorsagia circumcincta]|uniref:UNC93-like protein MFSD11 n=1 Tax=Teladorsagia circumcincta TaxID=45464 RepID=A0A2G9V1J3_TELCI|nr:hypothetical protein TELCIR_01563 [Teladorsagia circumcincta]
MQQKLVSNLAQVSTIDFEPKQRQDSQRPLLISVLRSLSQHDPLSGITSNSGYYSLAIIYLVFTVCNLFAPPIIHVLGAKWAQVLGAACYTSFMIQFLFLNAWRLYFFSAVLGFGAAGVYTACLSAATALNGGSEKIIAYVVFAMGAGQISGGLLFGVFPRSNRLNRSQIVILGMV